jgi:hypothetical protein
MPVDYSPSRRVEPLRELLLLRFGAAEPIAKQVLYLADGAITAHKFGGRP